MTSFQLTTLVGRNNTMVNQKFSFCSNLFSCLVFALGPFVFWSTEELALDLEVAQYIIVKKRNISVV